MKLATLNDGTRDGRLIVVKRDHSAYALATAVAPTLQAALDDWDALEPPLRALADAARGGPGAGPPAGRRGAALAPAARLRVGRRLGVPQPRLLVRKARNAEPPPTLETDPLVYQGGSGDVARPTRGHRARTTRRGASTSSPRSASSSATCRWARRPQDAAQHVRLVMLCNDVTLRNLIPDELAKGFGFFQSKPATAFSPFARHARRARRRRGRTAACTCALRSTLQRRASSATRDAGPEMHFSFFDLIAAHREDARASPPAPSSAAARCPTPTARAASRASPSAG